MQIKSDMVSNGHGPLSPSYVVIHETANPGATARNHVDYWKRNPDYAVHYVGDWTGIAWHCVPDDKLCWQVGNGNSHVVGIELCHATNKADFDKVWRLGVEWAAWALKHFGWGTDRLLSHNDCTRIWGGSDHTDPIGYFAEHGKTWEQFKADVASEMKGGNTVNKQKPGKAVNGAGLYYRAHVANLGWLDSVRDGQVAGTTGNGYQLEALKVQPPEGVVLDVSVHISNVGWKTYKGVQAGPRSDTGSSAIDPLIGSTGEGRGIEAVMVTPTKMPKGKRLKYRVHVGGFGWGSWTYAPYCAGTTGIDRQIEAIQFVLE